MFNVNERLATMDSLSTDEPTKIPTDHIFTMTGIANQSMSVLSTESLPGIIAFHLCVVSLWLNGWKKNQIFKIF